ncbi:hypothetical protein K443DRAFT_324 [Laccaria amethystina LaAM-08-1]|uniref:Uncharacterized protein n=1 Tax=Laccaria amethystina LaAM-08-1 TaxID=1095629 RepID=A0A0C9Y6R4_9AGAR|nr:hypothetical protein K443DRAFT_324 [Laccaria amethystina LaAM-08-1]
MTRTSSNLERSTHHEQHSTSTNQTEWPPPPRATPIIVPPHLRPKDPPLPTTKANTGSVAAPIQAPAGGGAAPKARGKQSSLQRAVSEKLEIQQAMSDLGKGKGESG